MVVNIEVGDHQMVNLLEARHIPCHLGNAAGVARIIESGVHEHRLAGWRHDQRRPSAFDIHPVDAQAGRLSRHADTRDEQHQGREAQ